MLETNVKELERAVAARRRGPMGVSTGGTTDANIDGGGGRPSLLFDPTAADLSAADRAIAVRGPGLYQSERGGLYLYVCDITENSVGAAVAGAFLMVIAAQGSPWWPLLSCVGAFVGAFAAGTPTAVGKFIDMAVGRRVGLVVKGMVDRVDELRLYYRTGKVHMPPSCDVCPAELARLLPLPTSLIPAMQVSYQWSQIYSTRIQPTLRDLNMEENVRSIVTATSSAVKRAQRVESRYQIGATAAFRLSQLRAALRSFWNERAPEAARRTVSASKSLAMAAAARFIRLFESRKQRRDRQLVEYRVGFLGERKWRKYGD